LHLGRARCDIGPLNSRLFRDVAGRALLAWLRSFGSVDKVGVEGTGSYGAGLTRLLLAQGITVVEVDRPNRQVRRRGGKSDPQDAINAARAAMSGD
jgi:transposase